MCVSSFGLNRQLLDRVGSGGTEKPGRKFDGIADGRIQNGAEEAIRSSNIQDCSANSGMV